MWFIAQPISYSKPLPLTFHIVNWMYSVFSGDMFTRCVMHTNTQLNQTTQSTASPAHPTFVNDAHRDLDNSPLTSKIKRVHPLTMVNMSVKFDEDVHSGLAIIVFTSLFPYMSIRTLTFDLLNQKGKRMKKLTRDYSLSCSQGPSVKYAHMHGWTEPQQLCYIPSATTCAGITKALICPSRKCCKGILKKHSTIKLTLHHIRNVLGSRCETHDAPLALTKII